MLISAASRTDRREEKAMSHVTIRRIASAATAGVAIFAGAQAAAQVPPDLVDKIAAIGRVSDPARTGPLYVPLHAKEPYAGVKVSRDLKYGPNERNALDVFAAEGASGARPVFMFVHGGGFIRGNKRAPGSPFYDNIMLWATKHGMVGVNMTYRLAPQHPWPAGQEDIRDAVRWVGANIATHGGDPNRVYLMGHSAGASHVALYLAHTQFHGPRGSGLVGAIMSSGTYDYTKVEEGEGRNAYFGPDRALYKERSPLPGLVKSSVPFMANAAELDPPWMVDQLNDLKTAMCESPRGCIRTLLQPNHNHMSQSYAIGTSDTLLTDQILAFMKAGK
jgi:acetyl esterase/lipase